MVLTTSDYSMSVRMRLPFDRAEEKVRAALREEGFGILTEIDIQEAFKEKLDRVFPRYKILGACNPPMAFEALSAEPELGTLLPCNVVLYEDGEWLVVSAMDPKAVLSLVGDPRVGLIATEVRSRLVRVLEAVAGLPARDAQGKARS
jgi:uncharacterized protein (DUF302 family)